ncbi:polysaccharide deacetylase family protein [Archangium violaceum]|uniref:polysaccharide deacetylase family protein n=1 Tax=Archangium violaceum TaxID=83451 RepID=UPI0019502D73|nr:polysaccharide deacetylase family protein [Archangium violaceum]QRN93190.1 polysaccharide deacetylase family protein [Archangium violaceum]
MNRLHAVKEFVRSLAVLGLALVGAPTLAATPFQEGMVSITLDDGWPSQYTAARPVLNQHGIHVTYFLVTEGIRNGWTGFMTVPQVQTVIAEGNEIGSHTMNHSDLTTLSAAQVQSELSGSQAWLKSQFGLASVPAFSSPYGAYNDSVLATVKQYYGSHRTVNGGQNFRDTNIFQLRSYDVNTSVTLDDVRTWLDKAAADKSWVILTFHQFVSGTPTQSTEINIDQFSQILDYIQVKGLRTVSVSEGVALTEGRTEEPVGDTPVYDDGMGNAFADWSWATHDLDDRTVVHSGLSSLSVQLGGWNSLYFHHTSGLDASLYQSIELWVNGGSSGGQGVRLAFYDGSQYIGSTRLDTVLGHPILAGTWQRVVVPLSSVGLSSGTVRDIYIQDDTGGSQGTLYLDDIRLIRSNAQPPPPPPTQPFALYADALASGFNDWSWAVHNLAQSSIVHAGTSAISVELDQWSALFFHSDSTIDLSRYKSIELWVHGGTSGGQVARLVFNGDSGLLGEIRLDETLGHAIQPGTWQRVSIPFSLLGLSSGSLREIYIQDQSGADQGTLYIDDIRLLP